MVSDSHRRRPRLNPRIGMAAARPGAERSGWAATEELGNRLARTAAIRASVTAGAVLVRHCGKGAL